MLPIFRISGIFDKNIFNRPITIYHFLFSVILSPITSTYYQQKTQNRKNAVQTHASFSHAQLSPSVPKLLDLLFSKRAHCSISGAMCSLVM